MAATNALLIPTQGVPRRITINRDADDSALAALYAAINTRIVECFVARDGRDNRGPHVDAWMDEEGRINGSEPNPVASGVIAYLRGAVAAPFVPLSPLFLGGGDIHFGNVVLAGYDAALSLIHI